MLQHKIIFEKMSRREMEKFLKIFRERRNFCQKFSGKNLQKRGGGYLKSLFTNFFPGGGTGCGRGGSRIWRQRGQVSTGGGAEFLAEFLI